MAKELEGGRERDKNWQWREIERQAKVLEGGRDKFLNNFFTMFPILKLGNILLGNYIFRCFFMVISCSFFCLYF